MVNVIWLGVPPAQVQPRVDVVVDVDVVVVVGSGSVVVVLPGRRVVLVVLVVVVVASVLVVVVVDVVVVLAGHGYIDPLALSNRVMRDVPVAF